MFPLLASWIESVGWWRHLTALLTIVAYRGYIKQITTDNTCQQWCSHQCVGKLNNYLEMVHTVSGYTAGFKISSKPGYGQLYIYYSADAATKQLGNQSNRGHMANMQWWDEMLRQCQAY
jgi:hypothetical protein